MYTIHYNETINKGGYKMKVTSTDIINGIINPKYGKYGN